MKNKKKMKHKKFKKKKYNERKKEMMTMISIFIHFCSR